MSHSRRNQLSSAGLVPDLFARDSRMTCLHVDTSSPTLSRSTSFSSTRASRLSTSPADSGIRRDLMNPSQSRSTIVPSLYALSPTAQSSSDSCEESTCSRCKLSEEEKRRLKAERRKEQNRASQRRFRAKKDNEIRGAADQVASLESMIQHLEQHNMKLSQTNATLMARVAELESQQSCDFGSDDPGSSTQPRHSQTTIPPHPPTDIVNYFWPVESGEMQHLEQLGTFLPLSNHELMPFEA